MTPTLEELRAAEYANGGPLQHPFHDPNFVDMQSGPHYVGKGFSVEFVTRETGVRGVVRIQVIWSPQLPSQRDMALRMEMPAYTRAFSAFAAAVKRRLDGKS